jgi:hypothetical protein
MSADTCDSLVAEYLREVENHVRDLPVLQRRELLRDLEAHVANERLEHPETDETSLLDMLERLGSPAAIAAAAYEEAGLGQTARQPALAAAAGAAIFAGAAARFSGRAAVSAPVSGAPASAPVSGAPASAVVGAPASAAVAVAAPGALVASVSGPPAAVAPYLPPAYALPAPKPEAYVPPPSAPAVPPPADLAPNLAAGAAESERASWIGRAQARSSRPGPFPPTGSGRPFAAGGAGRGSYSSLPPVAGAPMVPLTPARSATSWVGGAIIGAFFLVVLMMFGCIGGVVFLHQNSATEPATAVPAATAPPTLEAGPTDPAPPPTEDATTTAPDAPTTEPTPDGPTATE